MMNQDGQSSSLEKQYEHETNQNVTIPLSLKIKISVFRKIRNSKQWEKNEG